jgi:hypothetical protein
VVAVGLVMVMVMVMVMVIDGATVSNRTVSVWGADVLPALSVAVKVTVVMPWAVIGIDAEEAKTSVGGIGCAPDAL